jgi:methionyl-tRNA formyltransferase
MAAEGILNFGMTAGEAHSRFRAFTPRPGASIDTAFGPLKLWRCRPSSRTDEAGRVLGLGPDGIVIAMQQGSITVVEAQPAGKRPMTWNDLANGWRLKEGDSLKPRELPTV